MILIIEILLSVAIAGLLHETGNWTSYLWLNAYNGAGENSKTINTEGELILTIDYRA